MRALVWTCSAIALLAACGGSNAPASGDNSPFTSEPGKTVVVGAVADTPSAQASAGCVTLPSGACVDAKACGENERRDVVIDSNGKVATVVCYPADATPTVVNATGNVDLDKTSNNGVVSIDGLADGVDINGNVTASANNVTVYGHGPDVSIIAGDVTASGNNFALRGVTVQGSVEVKGGNNAALVLCRIQGSVHLSGNNNVLADCDIMGDVTIDGVNNVLIRNHIEGAIHIENAKNQVCDSNIAWVDTNGNHAFDVGEGSALLTCDGQKAK